MKLTHLRMGYQAYLVPRTVIDTLAIGFPPRFPKFDPHHVTIVYGVTQHESLPEGLAEIAVVGYASDRKGIEAFVCSVDGKTERPDGETYHITWSYDPAQGYQPKNSNELIQKYGWVKVSTGVRFHAQAKFL
jgi:hypothetical protein